MTEITPNQYWISPGAVFIKLNAMSDADYIQANVASGAMIMAYCKGLTIDGTTYLGYDAGHNYQRWPLLLSPTLFGDKREKYMYAAIPKTAEVNAFAVIVFPNERIDVYGKNEAGVQVGDTNYLYIFLQGIISASEVDGVSQPRTWTTDYNSGTLASDEAISGGGLGQWYEYNTVNDTVTFIKDIARAVIYELSLQRLSFGNRSVTGFASYPDTSATNDSTLVTPRYVYDYVNSNFLSKTSDDVAEGVITFLKGVAFANGKNGIDAEGNAVLESIRNSDFGKGLVDGRGFSIYRDDKGDFAAELDSLTLRRWLEVPELRLNRTVYIAGDLRQSACNGVVEEVSQLSASTGIFRLKLEDGEGGTCRKDDICIGVYQFGDGGDATDDHDDLRGNITHAGFTTCYFRVTDVSGDHNEIVSYELRPYTRKVVNQNTGTEETETFYGSHPTRFMKFAGYGNFTDKDRQTSTCITRSYIQFLRGVNDWEYRFKNIAMQVGNLSALYDTYRAEGCPKLSGYSAYLNNIYFTGKIQQIDPDTIDDIKDKINSYTVDFSDHVDVITVDDVGNVIGGLYTLDAEGNKSAFRVNAAITVRNNDRILTLAEEGRSAGKGTFKIYAEPVGCTASLKNSTLYITSIDYIKDGVAGTADDYAFDYDKMRSVNSCYVNLTIDCEGNVSLVKRFPVTVKHQSQPYVDGNLSNQSATVSWNTKSGRYIGLPFSSDFKLWHNNRGLDVTALSVIREGDTTPQTVPMDGSQVYVGNAGDVRIQVTRIEDADGSKFARIVFTGLLDRLSEVTNLAFTATAQYAGASYERTQVQTIHRTTDMTVYSLVTSVSHVMVRTVSGVQSSDVDNVTVAVWAVSSDDQRYQVTDLSGFKLEYSIDGSSWMPYPEVGVQVDASVKKLDFRLSRYGILWDEQSVPVILDGVDGAGVEFVFFAQADWVEEGGQTGTPTVVTTGDAYHDQQRDDYTPLNGVNMERWTDEPSGVSLNHRYEFYAMRKKSVGVWQPFGEVKLWNKYVEDGISPFTLDLSNEQSIILCDQTGTPLPGAAYEPSYIMLFKGEKVAYDLFDIEIIPVNITAGYDAANHTLNPSDITSDNASITVRCTLKGNTSVVLTATYKINKSYKGMDGVVYALVPSIDVAHRNSAGAWVDAMMSFRVKVNAGREVTFLATKEEMERAGLAIRYLSGSTYKDILDPTSVSTATVFGSASVAQFALFSGNEVLDHESINCVTDGTKTYVHVAYANSADGTVDFILAANATGSDYKYMGTCTSEYEIPPESPESYTWVRVRGDQGPQGFSPVVTYQGKYDSTKTYCGNEYRLDAVKYNGGYYIAKITAGMFAGYSPGDNTPYWRAFGASFESVATALLLAEEATIENLVADHLRMYGDNGSTFEAVAGLLKMTHPDGWAWEVTKEGVQIVGTLNGQRIELRPTEKQIRIYNTEGKISAIYSGETTTTYEFFSDTVTGWADANSYRITVADERTSGTDSRTVTASRYINSTPVKVIRNPNSIKENNGMVVVNMKGQARYYKTTDNTNVTGMLMFRYAHKEDGKYIVDGVIASPISATASTRGLNVVDIDIEFHLPAGEWYIMASYSAVFSSALEQCQSYADISFTTLEYAQDFYASWYLGNGIVLGSGKHNYFKVLHEGGNINCGMRTKSGYGFQCDSVYGLRATRNNYTGYVFPTIFYGMVKVTNGVPAVSAYVSLGGTVKCTIVPGGKSGLIRLEFPESYPILGYDSVIVNLTARSGESMNSHVQYLGGRTIDVESNDDVTNNISDFLLELKYIK